MDDKCLVEMCARKDEAAWESFLSTFSDTIYTSIRRTLAGYGASPDRDTVEDIFGGLIVSLLEDGGRRLLCFEGRNSSRLSTYLWVIAARNTVDHLRKTARERGSLASYHKESDRLANACEPPDRDLERRQGQKAVAEVLDDLSATDRLFVRLYYEKGLPTEEIASFMGISASAVYSRKNRVREKMRKILCKKPGKGTSKY